MGAWGLGSMGEKLNTPVCSRHYGPSGLSRHSRRRRRKAQGSQLVTAKPRGAKTEVRRTKTELKPWILDQTLQNILFVLRFDTIHPSTRFILRQSSGSSACSGQAARHRAIPDKEKCERRELTLRGYPYRRARIGEPFDSFRADRIRCQAPSHPRD